MNKKNLMATLVLFASVVAFAPAVVSQVEAAGTVPPNPPADAWAWCGVHPDDPVAVATAHAMADAGGIDATFGPCYDGPVGYSPAEPGIRYDPPAVYRRLVDINAAAGMKTIVFDKRLWSTTPAVRSEAIDYWMPVIGHIAAWDMGDEFNPNSGAQDNPPFQWNILKTRWAIMNGDVLTRTGVRPFTNHLYFATDEALADLPGTEVLLSFTRYDGDLGAAIARRHDATVQTLMCGVNAFDHGSFRPTAKTIRDDMAALALAGCDQFLVFGGQLVYKSVHFGDFSLVDKFGVPTDRAAAAKEGSGQSSYTPVGPARLLETRVGEGLSTVDGGFNGGGARLERSVTELEVVRRAGVPVRAGAVVLNITVTNPVKPGFITVYPCGDAPPNAAQLNYTAQATVSTAVVAKLTARGTVCIYTLSETDLIVDVNGFFPDGGTFEAMQPSRLLETRVGDGLATADGQFNGGGVLAGGSVLQLPVGGRSGVPTNAAAAVLTVTVTNTAAPGFVTVFPCGGSIPTAATLNYVANATVTNAAIVRTAAGGTVCLYTSAQVDMVVDVNGFHPAAASFVAVDPSRFLETRTGVGLSTIDGQQYGIGARAIDSITSLPVVGRTNIPATVGSVVLNITVTEPRRAGFVVAFNCDNGRPNAASVNYLAGATVSNMVVAEVSAAGTVCIYTMSGTQLVVDVTSYHP